MIAVIYLATEWPKRRAKGYRHEIHTCKRRSSRGSRNAAALTVIASGVHKWFMLENRA
jgi:hypothetical protein